jgi:hypothetical protein
VNTVFVSLLASARLHDIEPLAYLRDLLCLLPSWPRQRLLELAPAYGKQTFEQPETQQKLAANVFRRVLLSPDRTDTLRRTAGSIAAGIRTTDLTGTKKYAVVVRGPVA